MKSIRMKSIRLKSKRLKSIRTNSAQTTKNYKNEKRYEKSIRMKKVNE